MGWWSGVFLEWVGCARLVTKRTTGVCKLGSQILKTESLNHALRVNERDACFGFLSRNMYSPDGSRYYVLLFDTSAI